MCIRITSAATARAWPEQGVTVRRIVGWYKLGLTPEEISTEVPHLSLAQVYAALTYYHANRDEIEEDIAAEDAEAKQLEAQQGLPRNAT